MKDSFKMDKKRSTLQFFVNGKKISEPEPCLDQSLAEYLRVKLNLRGTKVGCGQGACGACTVMLSHYDKEKSAVVNKTVVACLVPLCAVHGYAITTIEGIGSTRTGLHQIQQRLVDHHGIQCGFCTPGMVMSMYTLLRNGLVTAENIEKALQGNLCRCTGYYPILQAFQTFAKDEEEGVCQLGEKCCKNKALTNGAVNHNAEINGDHYDPTQEPIFPSELQIYNTFDQDVSMFADGDKLWFRVTSIAAALKLKKEFPGAILVAGSTQAGMYSYKSTNVIIALAEVKEMKETEIQNKGIKLGGAVTINGTIEACKIYLQKQPETNGKFTTVVGILEKYGSEQIRNMATIGGSLFSSKNNSDGLVALVAAGAQITMMDKDGKIATSGIVNLFENGSFRSPHGSIVLYVFIPQQNVNEYSFCGKHSSRKAMDRATVNAGLRLRIDEENDTIREAAFCFGGLGGTVLLVSGISDALIGRTCNGETFEFMYESLSRELLSKSTMANKEYRVTVVLGFMLRFYTVTNMLRGKPLVDTSALSVDTKSVTRGAQVFEEVPEDQNAEDPIGRPIAQVTSMQMSTGEALYYTDLPKRSDGAFLARVQSTKAHAKILNVDMKAALELDGVHGYVDHRDIPGSKYYGGNPQCPLFAIDEVVYEGHLICGIVACDERTARRAAKLVVVEYEEMDSLISIEEAIKERSFEEGVHKINEISKGSVEENLGKNTFNIEGVTRISTQEHFYMEPQCAMVVPTGEANEYDIYVGTQWPNVAQADAANALGIPRNRIRVHQKRIGGGFGGKEGYTVASTVLVPAAVAAYKFRVPIHAYLNRSEDMKCTDKRHPMLINSKTSFDANGNISAVKHDAYLNSGSMLNDSAIIAMAYLINCDSAYNIPNYFASTRLCRTNIVSPSSMRGFGQPQGIIACENVINDVADYLGVPAERIREKHLYQVGDRTVCGNDIKEDFQMTKLWKQMKENANVEQRRKDINAFNKTSRWKKRGLAMMPTKYGVGLFDVNFLHQGTAFISIYTDGSVMLAHGGVEMGQGINTKMVQVASRELQIPMDRIHTSETATDVAPNASKTCGSKGTDLFGPAVIDACRKIMTRLIPFKNSNPSGSWNDWVLAAFNDRVSLSATGFSREVYSENLKDGFSDYFTYGVVCTEVELDCLTGQYECLEVDIILDVGRSLNPGIDAGQIEGAFVQGMGFCTTEEILRSAKGNMTNAYAEGYKIPTVADIPRKMKISILKGGRNPVAIYSSRGIGEPPILMGTSVFFAIKDAIKASRHDNGLSGPFRLDCPATVERIRMACQDKFVKMANPMDNHPSWYQ